jgi:hypothetical protein
VEEGGGDDRKEHAAQGGGYREREGEREVYPPSQSRPTPCSHSACKIEISAVYIDRSKDSTTCAHTRVGLPLQLSDLVE